MVILIKNSAGIFVRPANIGFDRRARAKKAAVKKRKLFERSEFLRFRKFYLPAIPAAKRSWHFLHTFSKKVWEERGVKISEITIKGSSGVAVDKVWILKPVQDDDRSKPQVKPRVTCGENP